MKWLIAISVAMVLGQVSCSPRAHTGHDETTTKEAPSKDGPVKVEEAAKEIDSGIQLLDVRTAEEWETGFLKGATRVSFGEPDLVGRAKAAVDPAKPVLVYCRSGARSAKAAQELRSAGFAHVLELDGGVIAWEKAGKPLVKGQ
ncbi:rhodanese-like domain-containing protein [Haloferula sp. BvORR071]|uniref:rhodanese-like domain-containing protein n=1 Tax=Haloferula sp. BvORR071 TaxID=1396141 RepID=UPI00055061AE|nr:rhodanese-like domain-containing protein [Haloferula sp. BvORR071]